MNTKRLITARLAGLAAAIFPALVAFAAERQVALIEDPAGDDDGNGALVYPQRGDLARGDLDLTALRVVRVDDRYRFDATFRNPVRNPTSVKEEVGAASLSEFARRGFYAFNLDLYFDLDRVPGAGYSFALPGRQVSIDPAFAWERAVVLTPRPETMRQQLIDALADSAPERESTDITAWVDGHVMFATQVRVRGRTVSFEVPASFFGEAPPDQQWALTAFVTGAKISIEADLSLLSTRPAVERTALGVLQPSAGRPRETFGYSTNRVPSPVVDLLASNPERQRSLLGSNAPLTGVSFGTEPAASQAAREPVRSILAAIGVTTPATTAAPAAPAAPAPASAPASARAAALPAPAPQTPATTATTAATPSAAAPAAAPGATATARPSAAERLQTLKQLLDQKLIDEAEYRQLRQRILSEL